jgi:hypothetical protein
VETFLIPAALVLVVTNIVFAYLANHWRRKAKRAEHDAMGMAYDLSRTAKDNFDAGLTMGLKQGTGGMYLAAVRVEADEGVLEALRAAGRKLLKEFEEPIVQVPESV